MILRFIVEAIINYKLAFGQIDIRSNVERPKRLLHLIFVAISSQNASPVDDSSQVLPKNEGPV